MKPTVRTRGLPVWLLAPAAIAYLVLVVAITMGTQPPERLNVAGNLALLAPLGVLVALAWPSRHPLLVVVAGFLLSCATEATQLLVLSHRDPSLNDIALNTSGAALGWILGRTGHDVLVWFSRR